MDTASSTPTVAKTPGTVITFYSFKGGVGRSMALANVAVLLARANKSVLCVDWDLEAPGLDRYFRAVPRSSPNSIPLLSEPAKRGGLLAVLNASTPDDLARWQDYVCTRTGADGTKLDFIGSGDDDEDYSTKLGAFSWTEFFSQRSGGDVIEALRKAWKKDYDYVLIDSRTGLTDSSGVCTIQMPDLIVMLSQPTSRTLIGASESPAASAMGEANCHTTAPSCRSSLCSPASMPARRATALGKLWIGLRANSLPFSQTGFHVPSLRGTCLPGVFYPT